MGGKEAVYALYLDDTFIDVGTARELAERRGMKPESIRGLSYPWQQARRNPKTCVFAYRVEEDDE